MQAEVEEAAAPTRREWLQAAQEAQEAEVLKAKHQHQPRLIQVPAAAAAVAWLEMG